MLEYKHVEKDWEVIAMLKRCKGCQNKIKLKGKYSRSRLCPSCYGKLPEWVCEHPHRYSDYFVYSIMKRNYRCFEKKTAFYNVEFDENLMRFAGVVFSPEEIEGVEVDFEPKEYKENTSELRFGDVVLKITLREAVSMPQLCLEYVLCETKAYVTMYGNDRNSIAGEYVVDADIISFINSLKAKRSVRYLRNTYCGFFTMQDIADARAEKEQLRRNMEEYYKNKSAAEEKRRAYEKQRAEEERKKAEEKRRAEEERKRAEEKRRAEEERRRQKRRSSGKSNVRSAILFEEAKKKFELSEPYTLKDVRKARNRLIKMYHPDAGGTTEDAQKINVMYAELVKHAI
jgi:flagellar biosynthesis GTPase FlhF